MDFVEIDDAIQRLSVSHRRFVHPLLRALLELGGSAPKKEVIAKLRDLLKDHLNQRQIDYLVAKGRFGWVRLESKRIGLLGGEHGTWALTDLGRSYAEAHKEEPLTVEGAERFPEITDEEAPGHDVPTETVPATFHPGFAIPLLEVMAEGFTKKHEIFAEIEKRLAKDLLAGDKRRMPGGAIVFRYRASWALTDLRRAGEAANVGTGLWRITDAGKERYAKDKKSWKLQDFQGGQATVVVENGGTSPKGPPRTPQPSWESLSKLLLPEIFSVLHARLRPDLGPTPSSPRQYVPRNVILYGPPGTGKTYIAKQIATALTGETDDEDETRWEIVQFHPSYAYEDFVQGMRPDLESTSLRYRLAKGPFLEMCERATEEPDKFFVLIIDEINRGDPARIFGELLYALEYRNQPVGLPLGGSLTVPPNLVVLGTMNSVDRSVALVDYALRRRFGFIRVDPNPNVIMDVLGSHPAVEVAARALESFNNWLGSRLDREHRLGHSFFLNPAIELRELGAIDKVWALDIEPLLEEYFFGDLETQKAAKKAWEEAIRQADADLAGESEDESTEPS